MWTPIILLIVMLNIITGKLIGDHICHQERTYTVNVTQYFTRNSTVRNYKWCLNVPPRCSFYTFKVINDSRVVEQPATGIVELCCPGYIEIADTCIPDCPHGCRQGKCEHGKCVCNPGFTGDTCHLVCQPSLWGPDCKNQCKCERGICNPVTGSCACPSGYIGTRCQLQCSFGYYGKNCAQKCRCLDTEVCDIVTGLCSISRNRQEMFRMTLADEQTTVPTVKESEITTKGPKNRSVLLHQNNGKFQTKIVRQNSSTIASVPVKNDSIPFSHEATTKKDDYETPLITDQSSVITNTSKTKVIERQFNNNDSVNLATRLQRKETPYGSDDESMLDRVIFSSFGASVAVLITIITISLALMMASRYRSRNKKLKAQAEKANKEASTFDNPAFVTPSESSPLDGQIIETTVVCSVNFKNSTSKDSKEYFYDHPLSTSSFRPVSIGEPFESSKCLQAEPVYDEIPSGVTPVENDPASSLYMNTLGKTRL